jgi:hypothetical protein
MLRLGQKVIITGDSLEMNLPVGSYGYIIAYDKNPDNVFDYVIRVPKMGRHYYVTAADIELEEELLRKEAERVEREALIDFALATRNEELFTRIMNGDDDKEDSEKNKKPMSREDFIRQIHLKAWI